MLYSGRMRLRPRDARKDIGVAQNLVHADGSIDLAPLQNVLAEEFSYDSHQDAEELIIAACQEAQHLYGWVPQEAAQAISDHLRVSINRIYGLLTFYADFRTEPPGDHTLLLCHGAACFVMGSQKLIETLGEDYDVGDGQVTRDGSLTLQVVNGCLGVCDIAPVIQVDHHTYCGHLDPDRLRKMIDTLERGEPLEADDDDAS